MTNFGKWSDAKLEKELCFARAALDERHPETAEWLKRIAAETDRRALLSQPTR